jgi:hypothetical protein
MFVALLKVAGPSMAGIAMIAEALTAMIDFPVGYLDEK